METLLSTPGLIQLPADTIVTIAARDGFDLIIAIAAGLIAATFLAVLFGLIYVFRQTHKAIRAVERMRRNLLDDQAIENLRRTTAHMEGISAVVQEEVSELTRSLGTVSERIQQASDRMEERIEEFNALVEVVQREAEGVFLDTASTARGVRSGVRKGLAETEPASRDEPRPQPAEPEAAPVEPPDDPMS